MKVRKFKNFTQYLNYQKDYKIKMRIIKYITILLFVIFLILSIIYTKERNEVNLLEAENTTATITGVSDLYTTNMKELKIKMGNYYRIIYSPIMYRHKYNPIRNYKIINYKYKVNNIEYDVSKQCFDREFIYDIEVGETIEITYNKNNPNESMIGRYKIIIDIYTLFIFLLFVLMYVLDRFSDSFWEGSSNKRSFERRANIDYETIERKYLEKKKRNSTTVLLKVTKIDSIDYERETVYFFDKEGNLYFYETDFGEDFKIDVQYEIRLNSYTCKKRRIEFDDKKIKAFKIINTEKKDFKEVYI